MTACDADNQDAQPRESGAQRWHGALGSLVASIEWVLPVAVT